MRNASLCLAACFPLVLISAAHAAMDEMEAPEMRMWSTVLQEPTEEAPGTVLQITASQSASESNSLVIESVGLVSTQMSKDDEGNMTETMGQAVVCAGPFMVEGRSFMVETAPMEEEGEMKKDDAKMAEASESEPEPCAFAVTGEAWHTYRAWHSWDFTGSVTVGEASMDFEIADKAPAMLLEMESEEEMSEEAEKSS